MNWRKFTPRERIGSIVEAWFVSEPLLFAAWTTHEVLPNPRIATIRVGGGSIEFNPDFIRSLRRDELHDVLMFETMRILLGHPYSRRLPQAELSYQASNLSVQECLRTKLPIPRPRELFGDEAYDDQYFEVYYNALVERAHEEPPPPPNQQPSEEGRANLNDSPDGLNEPEDDSEKPDDAPENESENDPQNEPKNAPQTGDLEDYANAETVGQQNVEPWQDDDLRRNEIAAAVQDAAATNQWGSLAGSARSRLLATLRPRLDYRGILRRFRQSVLSVDRRLTRMKPSRRYDWDQMGSQYDFTTNMLVAIDVSGSMSERDVTLGLSVVNQFFRYGVRSIDVICFDTQIQGGVKTLRSARRQMEITGRGGTDFSCVMHYVDSHRQYDGLIVLTDGCAPVPTRPRNRRTRILWLFQNQQAYQSMAATLRPLGATAYIHESKVTSSH